MLIIKNTGKHLFLSLIIIINLLNVIKCNNEVLGCGGFVKSIVSINYGRINIKLLTAQGNVKYVTDCAPNNGYYFIPLYDKGNYELKIESPQGWSFDPKSVSLNIDGNDACSLQHDINFNFKGFTINGRVFSDGSASGPAGVRLTLRAKQSENMLKSIESSPDGFYQFNEVFPGEYIIEGSHDLWTFKSNKIEVSVIDDNINVLDSKNSITILGYEVTGKVMSDGDPIKNVLFALYSKDNVKSVSGCDSKQIPITKQLTNDWKYLCHVSSQESGLFRFSSVPTGNYMLVPFYRGKHIQFDVKPSQLNFRVGDDNIKVEPIFQIEGFSVSGRVVVQASGEGIPGAQILLKDENTRREQVITTQENGVFHLENVKTGNYKISVKAKHIHFIPIEIKISPTSSQIPEIVANAFDVCGQLIFKSSPSQTSVIVSGSDNFNENIIADDSGNFCIPLKPGSYKIKAVSLKSPKSIRFTPAEKSITVKYEPLLNLQFIQFTAFVSGSVKSIGVATDIQINLVNKELKEVVKSLKYSQLKQAGTKLEFKFDNILPGSYVANIEKGSNSWCWVNDEIEVEVINKDVTDLQFVQKGFLLNLYFSHAVSLNIKSPSNKIETINVESKEHTHCLTESGLYSISPIGCHKFSESNQEVITFDTNKDSNNLISRTAVKHLLSASIITDLNVTDIVLTVKIKSFGSEETTEKLYLQQHRVVKSENKALIEFPISIWVKPMVNIYLEPSSNQLLFKPNSFETKIENDCIQNLVTFRGRTGLFINGEIIPKLEGVAIRITNSDDELLFSTSTDALGKYVAGPFDSDIQLNVFAQKEGYIFKNVANALGNFEASRLAKVNVKVVTDTNETLANVLISMSGGTDNYRKNSITPASGVLSFNDLHSGQYFIRTMMKEYEFDPPSKMINVEEGSTVDVVFNAKKVAFSCIGITDSLNGEPEGGVVVEAIGIRNSAISTQMNCSQLQEEAVSEHNGSFRIRGLRPECQYAIRIKPTDEKNRHIERSVPKNRIIRVDGSDINGVRIIVFRKMTHMDVSGDVVTSPQHLSSLKVRLFSELNPDQPISALALSSSAFFFFSSLPIDNRSYFIRLESSLSNNMFDYDTPVKSFKANTSYFHFSFHFNPKAKVNSNFGGFNEHEQGSIYMMPFVLFVIILTYNYSKVLPILNQLLDLIHSHFAFNTENSENSPAATRKKNKSRKI